MKRRFFYIGALIVIVITSTGCGVVEQPYYAKGRQIRYRHSYETRRGAIGMAGSASFNNYQMKPYTSQNYFRVQMRRGERAEVILRQYVAEFCAQVFYEGAEHPYARHEYGKYSFFHDENVRLRRKFQRLRGRAFAGTDGIDYRHHRKPCKRRPTPTVRVKNFKFVAMYDGYYLIEVFNPCHQAGAYDLEIKIINKYGQIRE